MTSAQVVETSVNVISNSPSQDYTHPDDRTLLYFMTICFVGIIVFYYFQVVQSIDLLVVYSLVGYERNVICSAVFKIE